MNYTVDTCPLTKFEGGLNLLHKADHHMAGIYSDCSTPEINTVVGNFHDTQHICSNAFNGKKQQNQSDYHNEQMTGSGILQYTAKTCSLL